MGEIKKLEEVERKGIRGEKQLGFEVSDIEQQKSPVMGKGYFLR